MSPQKLSSLLLAIACVSHVGCMGFAGGPVAQALGCPSCRNSCDPGCGISDVSCGCADACCDAVSCGVADPGCACPEPACGCDVSCGVPSGCGSGVGGCSGGCAGGCCPNSRLSDHPFLIRMRNFFCGVQSCGTCPTPSYYGDWQSTPSSTCQSCNQHSSYNGPRRQTLPRSSLARRGLNVADDIRFADSQETTYR